MPAFHVFVDGPVDPSPNATMQLAEAMAKRYGLPTNELSSRLARGRFRVKSNVDRTTADAYLKDLTALGARVTIEEVDTGHAPAGAYRAARVTSDPIPNTNVRASQQIPLSRSERTSTPPAGVAQSRTAPPAGVSRTATPAVGVATPVSRTATPPAGVSRTATPPAGVSRTATPPAGIATPRTTTPNNVSRAAPPVGAARTAIPIAGLAPDTSPRDSASGLAARDAASARDSASGLASARDSASARGTGSGLSASSAGGRTLGTSESQPIHRAESEPLHRAESQPLHRAESQPIHRAESQPLHRTSESQPIGRANTPASGLAAAGIAATSPARPSNPTGLAVAGALRSPSQPIRPTSQPLPTAEPRAASTSNPPAFSSGLSAAFSSEIPLDLGALGDDQALSLASVDGVDDTSAASFEPPDASADIDMSMDEPMPASIGPAPMPASIGPAPMPASIGPTPMPASIGPAPSRAPTSPAPSRPTPAPAKASQPLDLFAPPEAADDAATDFAIADERPARPSAPPATTTGTVPTSSARISQPMLVQPAPTSTAVKPAMPRNRFLAGVLLAIVLGFVPAHFIGASRESSAYGEIDRKVQQYQADPTVSDDEVTTFRTAQLDAKKSKRTMIALTSLLVWAAASAALAYVWFRRIPWDRVDGQAS